MNPDRKKPLQRRHVEALVAIGDHLSVHGAARQLGIAQPALSRLLGEAERLLGARLFERTSHGSRPTAQGNLVLARARFLRRAMERLEEAVTEAPSPLRLGCIPRAMHTLMPLLLERLYPAAGEGDRTTERAGFRFSISEDSSAALFEMLARGSLDFAILRNLPEASTQGDQILFERLYDERTVFVCSANNSAVPTGLISLPRLAAFEWVLPESRTSSRVAFDRFWSDNGMRPMHPIIEARSFESNLALVARTHFVSIAPDSIAREQANLNRVRIVKVRQGLPKSSIMLAYDRLALQDPLLHGFREAVLESARLTRLQLRGA